MSVFDISEYKPDFHAEAEQVFFFFDGQFIPAARFLPLEKNERPVSRRMIAAGSGKPKRPAPSFVTFSPICHRIAFHIQRARGHQSSFEGTFVFSRSNLFRSF